MPEATVAPAAPIATDAVAPVVTTSEAPATTVTPAAPAQTPEQTTDELILAELMGNTSEPDEVPPVAPVAPTANDPMAQALATINELKAKVDALEAGSNPPADPPKPPAHPLAQFAELTAEEIADMDPEDMASLLQTVIQHTIDADKRTQSVLTPIQQQVEAQIHQASISAANSIATQAQARIRDKFGFDMTPDQAADVIIKGGAVEHINANGGKLSDEAIDRAVFAEMGAEILARATGNTPATPVSRAGAVPPPPPAPPTATGPHLGKPSHDDLILAELTGGRVVR